MDIQKILKLPQKLPNLTGAQITEVLNTLLYSALQPIFLSTNLGRICCAEVLTKAHDDHRRKFSILNKNEFIDILFNCMLHKPKDSWEYFKSLKLERSVSFKILLLFLDILKDYENKELEYCINRVSLHDYEKQLGCSYKLLGCILNNAKFYLEQYLSFKNLLMQKYYLLAYKEACKKIKSSTTYIDKNDLWKTLIIAMSSAIDKYNEERGALTSFINWSFKGYMSNPENGYEYGQAYTIPYYHKLKLAKNNVPVDVTTFAYSLDEGIETNVEEEKDYTNLINVSNEKLIDIINSVPGTELACLVLGIAKK